MLINHYFAVKYDFESLGDIKSWKGWSQSPQKIKRVKGDAGGNALEFTAKGWNTAIIALKPPFVVTATSVLRFKVKTSKAGSWEINLSNASEKAQYVIPFSVVHRNKWTSILIVLKNAVHKRGGKLPHDGMIGDKLSSVQIAFHGKKILIDDFEIVNLSPDDKNIKDIPKLSK